MEKIIVNEKNAGLFFTQHGSQRLKELLTAEGAGALRAHAEETWEQRKKRKHWNILKKLDELRKIKIDFARACQLHRDEDAE